LIKGEDGAPEEEIRVVEIGGVDVEEEMKGERVAGMTGVTELLN